jgi:hypothetical protein
MIDEDVKQTRCTTCDAEHVYKGAKEPRRRSRKDSPAGLFHEVLAGMPDAGAPAAVQSPDAPAEDLRSEDEVKEAAASREQPAAQEAPAAPADDREDEAATPSATPVEEGPIHRRLIRAQLPRPEGQKEVRQVPDFTIRSNSNAGRGGGHFRGGRGYGGAGQPDGNGHGAGNRPHGRRFAGGGSPGMPGGRPGGGRGPSTGPGRGGRPGFGPSTGAGRGPAGPGRGPRKRSR